MNITNLAEKTGIAKQTLINAAEDLGIKRDDLKREDIINIHTFLKNRPQLKVSARSLRILAEIEPKTFSVDRKKVVFLGGGIGFKPKFILSRRNDKIEMQRRTRNCGDTADLVMEGLKCQKITMRTERGKTRHEFCDYLRQKATKHEVWQVTIHQHTFTLERCTLGNWIVQSYQCSNATYDVKFWCGLESPFIDLGAKDICGPLAEKWYMPSNKDLSDLAGLIDNLYDEGKEKRGATWRLLPFHPKDTGRILEESEVLVFTAEKTVLSAARWAPCTVAGLEMVIFK